MLKRFSSNTKIIIVLADYSWRQLPCTSFTHQTIAYKRSSDMVLYKAAGATDCATGKFFNLRRFTKSRYEEPQEGGGQLPYWFEHSLFAFLREADLLRLLNRGYSSLIGCGHSTNHWSKTIMSQFKNNPNKPWLAYSWRHYLSWFGKTESELDVDDSANIVKRWLKTADSNWADLEDDDLLFDERRNCNLTPGLKPFDGWFETA